MRRNCNLELRLLPPESGSLGFSDCKTPSDHQMLDMLSGSQEQEQKQQLTIFYNGKMAVCDVTELQARAIIYLASKQKGERSNNPCNTSWIQHQLHSPTGLSMKKSLKRFLQKRNNRIQA